jgi:hypothetical protein
MWPVLSWRVAAVGISEAPVLVCSRVAEEIAPRQMAEKFAKICVARFKACEGICRRPVPIVINVKWAPLQTGRRCRLGAGVAATTARAKSKWTIA